MSGSITKIKIYNEVNKSPEILKRELGKTKRSQMLLSRIQKLLRTGQSPFGTERTSLDSVDERLE